MILQIKRQKQKLMLKSKQRPKQRPKPKSKHISNQEYFIFIDHYAGFGNYIYDLILGYYLKKRFQKKVYVVEYSKNLHVKGEIEWLHTIFPNLKMELHFITKEESQELKRKNRIENMKENDLKKMEECIKKKIKNYSIRIFTYKYYPWIYSIFLTFTEDEKNKFSFESSSFYEKYKDMIQEDFTGIHIRYGDKLLYGINKKNDRRFSFMSFPIYTPEYYHEQIMKLIKEKNEKIYIFTDSVSVVQQYLYHRFQYEKYPNIQIMDIPFLDTFYILLHAKKFIMSHSTFSYAIYLLRKNIEQECILCSIQNIQKKYKSYDCFLFPKWKIIYGKEYILNLQQKKIKEMFEFSKKKIQIIKQTNEINEIVLKENTSLQEVIGEFDS
jgi:hypothetical protein